MVGLIDKEEQVTRSQISDAGLDLFLLGGWPTELGGSYYLQTQFNKKEGTVPEVNLENEKKLQDLLISLIETRKIRAAHDLSEGGLLVCLTEMLFAKNELGGSFSIFTGNHSVRLDALLFGESQGRVVVATNPENINELQDAAKHAGVEIDSLGKANDSGNLEVTVNGKEILSSKVSELRSLWENAIPEHMESSSR